MSLFVYVLTGSTFGWQCFFCLYIFQNWSSRSFFFNCIVCETNMKKKFKWPLKKLLIIGCLNLTYQRNRLDLPPDLNFQNPQTWEHQNHNWIQTPFLYDNFQKRWSRPSKIFQLFTFQPFQPFQLVLVYQPLIFEYRIIRNEHFVFKKGQNHITRQN